MTAFPAAQATTANVDDFYLFPRRDGTAYVGISNGLLQAVQRWNPDIKRYSRALVQASSITFDRYTIGMEARALVDPLVAPSGIIVKVQDLVRAFFQGAVPIAPNVNHVSFLLGAQGGGSANPAPISLLGWLAIYDAVGVQPTWRTHYKDKTGGVVRRVDSGLSCDVPRLLSFVLDGGKQEIRWYADGVLVDSYKPASGAVAGQNTALGNDCIQYLVCSANGVAAGASFDTHLLGAPLVTVQFPDI